MASALAAGDPRFAHQTASQVPADAMPFLLQLLRQSPRSRRSSRCLVMLDQRGFKLLSLRVSLTLALTPSVKAAAVDAERPATPINAVLLVQLIDQRE